MGECQCTCKKNYPVTLFSDKKRRNICLVSFNSNYIDGYFIVGYLKINIYLLPPNNIKKCRLNARYDCELEKSLKKLFKRSLCGVVEI